MPDVDREQRAREHYHGLTVLRGAWIVLRVDGRSFSALTEQHYDKPFDPVFSDHMRATAAALLGEFGGAFAHTESDEISVLLPADSQHFNRSVEKLVSISAGLASATFTSASGKVAHFDSRIWVGGRADDVVDYFSWRQADAVRCGLNGWCYWTLRQSGADAAAATTALLSMNTAAKNDLLFTHGINFNEVPLWQRRGIGIYWETYEKVARNPLTGSMVTAIRRRMKLDEELPSGEAYRTFLRQMLEPDLGPTSSEPDREAQTPVRP